MLIPGKIYTPAEVLPHRGDMLLIDAIDSYGDDWVRSVVEVAGRGLFEDAAGRVPGWVGLEYMAQTAAAFAGIEQLQAGVPVAIGMLIGTRRYDCAVPHFLAGWRLMVTATLQLRDGDDLAVFDCTLCHDDKVLATADVKAFRPRDIHEFLETKR